MGFKRRTKADIAVDLLTSPMGQRLLDTQADEVARRLRAVEDERQALESELQSVERLRNGASRPKRGRKAAAASNGARASRRGVNAQSVIAGIEAASKEHGGAATIGQVAKQLGLKTATGVRPVLRQLVDDGAVKKTGQRRATRYRVA